MRRVRDERGAVAVVVALLMVPLMGFAAIGVDVAGMWSKQQQLRNGADAGALAIAESCGRGACGAPGVTAQKYVEDNHVGAGASGSVVGLDTGAGLVKVEAAATRAHLFAPVLGIDSSPLKAQATARWGSPTGGVSKLPLAFSWCEWKAQTNGGLPTGSTPITIFFPKTSDTGCTGPSNSFTPGGFTWLRTPGPCEITSTISQNMQVDPGISATTACSNSDIASHENTTVLLPIFDQVSGTGSNATYHVYGYAAFVLTAYQLGGQHKLGSPTPCSGNDRCIRGYFTRFVDFSEAFTYSPNAPSLGFAVVELTT